MVAYFKYRSTKRINIVRRVPGAGVWQRNYCEHIICNDDELRGIREYITNNPLQWAMDRENPDVILPTGQPRVDLLTYPQFLASAKIAASKAATA